MEILGVFAAVFCGVVAPFTAAICEKRDPVKRAGWIICGALIGAFLLAQVALVGYKLASERADAAFRAGSAEARNGRK